MFVQPGFIAREKSEVPPLQTETNCRQKEKEKRKRERERGRERETERERENPDGVDTKTKYEKSNGLVRHLRETSGKRGCP